MSTNASIFSITHPSACRRRIEDYTGRPEFECSPASAAEDLPLAIDVTLDVGLVDAAPQGLRCSAEEVFFLD
jgi:hypothetical protein